MRSASRRLNQEFRFPPRSQRFPAARRAKLGVDDQIGTLPLRLAPRADPALIFELFDGLSAWPGSPLPKLDGMLKGVEFSRVHHRPFLAPTKISYTLVRAPQHARHVPDTTTAEEDPERRTSSSIPSHVRSPSRGRCPQALRTPVRNPPSSRLVSARYYRREPWKRSSSPTTNRSRNSMDRPWSRLPSGRAGPNEECRAIESPAHRFLSRRCSSRNSHPKTRSHTRWSSPSCKPPLTGPARD